MQCNFLPLVEWSVVNMETLYTLVETTVCTFIEFLEPYSVDAKQYGFKY